MRFGSAPIPDRLLVFRSAVQIDPCAYCPKLKAIDRLCENWMSALTRFPFFRWKVADQRPGFCADGTLESKYPSTSFNMAQGLRGLGA